MYDENHGVKKLCLFELHLYQKRRSIIDKKESKSKMQSILVVLERLNGEHLVSERERKTERHTPLVFELERQKCPKLLHLQGCTQTRAGLLSCRPAKVNFEMSLKGGPVCIQPYL